MASMPLLCAGDLIVGTDAFVPEIPPTDPHICGDAASILRTLEACFAAGIRAYDFSLSPELIAALQELRRRHSDIRLIGNPSWRCGVELDRQELYTFRDRVLVTLFAEHATLRERIQKAPLSEIRRQWWTSVSKRAVPMTRSEIARISLNVGRFERRLRTAANLADALVLGADYADWLPLLDRVDILEEMFERAARCCPVFGIAHFTELTLAHLDKLPICGHFVPFGKHTAFFSHEGALRAAAACVKPIVATFSLIRERYQGESLTELIGFNLKSFAGSALLIGVSSPKEPAELVAAVADVKTTLARDGRRVREKVHLRGRTAVRDNRPCVQASEGIGGSFQPYMAVALTPRCNYRCPFCPPSGEQYRSAASEFGLSRVRRVLSAAASLGVRKVRFTGGEPLMFERLRECAEYAAELGLDIAINTNGLLISEHIRWMARIPGLSVRVNLGGTTPAVLQLVHGRAALDALRGGLELASDACVLQRLNVVLSRHNLLEVPPLLDLCRKLGTALKVFDLFGVPEMEDKWLSLYAPPSALGIHGVVPPVTQYSERFGIPSRTQVVDGVHVTIRDSALGTRYGRNCEQCARFPCQEGLYCLVVTPSTVRPCRLGPDMALPCDGDDGIETSLASASSVFADLHLADLFWRDRMGFYSQRLLECTQIVRKGADGGTHE